MKRSTLILILVLSLIYPWRVHAEEHQPVFQNACGPREQWNLDSYFPRKIPLDFAMEFSAFIQSKRLPVEAMAEGAFLAEANISPEANALANYWRGRTLFTSSLYSLAASQFNQIMEAPFTRGTLPFTLASMECMERLHKIAPHLKFSRKALINSLKVHESLPKNSPFQKTVRGPLLRHGFEAIAQGQVPSDALKALEGSKTHHQLLMGIAAARQSNPALTIQALGTVLSQRSLPSDIEKERATLQLLLGNAFYQRKQYTEALKEYEKVGDDSNDKVSALSRMASTHLLRGNTAHAIGTALLLNSGDFQKTFTPDTANTLAIGLNEYCRYPETKDVIRQFHRDYGRSKQWLRHAVHSKGIPTLYSSLVDYVNGRPSSVPTRVVSELAHSPTFLEYQKGINSIFQTEKKLPELRMHTRSALSELAKEIQSEKEILREMEVEFREIREIAELESLIKEYEAGIIRSGTPRQHPLETPLIKAQKDKIAKLKSRRQRVKEYAPQWISLLNQVAIHSGPARNKIVHHINKHLLSVIRRMDNQLRRVFTEIDVIETEILLNASREMIQDLSGDNRKVTTQWQRLQHKTRKSLPHLSPVETMEVWEDEIGTLESSLTPKCKGKKLLSQSN